MKRGSHKRQYDTLRAEWYEYEWSHTLDIMCFNTDLNCEKKYVELLNGILEGVVVSFAKGIFKSIMAVGEYFKTGLNYVLRR